MSLMSQDIVDDTVKDMIMNLESKGLEQYESFRKEVLETGTKSAHDKIPKNLFPLMSTSLKRANLAVNKIYIC